MKLKHSLVFVLILFIFFMVGTGSEGIAQEEKWVVYNAEFASFPVRWDFEINHTPKDTGDSYIISFPKFPESRLYISNGNKEQVFHLSKKEGYRVQEVTPFGDPDKICYGKKGLDSKGYKWREMYITYMGLGTMGPIEDRIYIVYEGAPGELSRQFDKVIDALKVKNNVQLDTTPSLP